MKKIGQRHFADLKDVGEFNDWSLQITDFSSFLSSDLKNWMNITRRMNNENEP
jgi:hypothetical protein